MTTPAHLELDSLPCGILKIDKDRNVLFCNRYTLALSLHESVDVIVGRSVTNLFSVATSILIDSYLYPMLLDEGKTQEMQLSLKTAHGESIPIVANIHMNPDKTTCWTFMSCINRDKLYNQLLSARDELQAQALILTKSQERQSDLQTFCQSLSHDFTGPLRRIHQLIDIALEDLNEKGIEAPDEFKLLLNAQNNAEGLIRLTKGLVEYLVADVVVPRDELVDVAEIVSTVQALREEQGDDAPEVHITSLPILRGSKAQLQVLFKNLIDNAITYNENTPEIFISHTVDIPRNRAVIAVKDNGVGMSDAHIDTIFTPFTRLNSRTQSIGCGLGLSIAKKMVTKHGGDIRVESAPGAGSTFFVSLPYLSNPGIGV